VELAQKLTQVLTEQVEAQKPSQVLTELLDHHQNTQLMEILPVIIQAS